MNTYCELCGSVDHENDTVDVCKVIASLRSENAALRAQVEELAKAGMAIVVAAGINDGSQPVTGPEVLLLMRDAETLVAALSNLKTPDTATGAGEKPK